MRRAALAIAAALLASAAAAGDPAGRQIFVNGGDDIAARFAGTQAMLPPAVRRCAGCHGRDGEGGREGGTEIAPITWAALTKARPAAPGRPGRPAYDAVSLRHVLTAGVDAGGRSLAPGMPRFVLTPAQETALLEFLHEVGTDGDVDPGVAADEIRVGAVLPLTGAHAAWGTAMRSGIEAALAAAGPIYGRRLRLVAADASDDVGAAVRRMATSNDVFALVATLLPEGVDAVEDLPVIAPLTLEPAQPGTRAFHVLASATDQMRVLVDALADETAHPLRLAAIGAAGPVADAVMAQVRRNRGTPMRLADIGDLTEPIDAVLALPGTDLGALLGRLGERPLLVAAGAGALGLERAADERLRLALPILPVRPDGPPLAQAAAVLLIEGVKRMGARATRTGLVAALETLRDVATGVTPPLSFSRGQHDGTSAAVVVHPDRTQGMVATTSWRAPR